MGANRRRIEREVATERRWRHSRKPSEGDQAGDRHQRMAIERAQVDFPDQLAGRAPAGGVVPIRLSPGCWAQPPFDPVMMTALLLYSYCSGIYSSRHIAKACRERVDFMSIVGFDAPDFRTISEFRKRHLKALSALFQQVLQLCETAGLVKLGHVALDGTKIKANASKHKAMSYERMEQRATELEAEVGKWFAVAEATDAEEDKRYGADKTGEEMPDWVTDKRRRAERIRQAKAELEAEAKASAEAKLKAAAEAQQRREAEGRKKSGPPAAPPLDHA